MRLHNKFFTALAAALLAGTLNFAQQTAPAPPPPDSADSFAAGLPDDPPPPPGDFDGSLGGPMDPGPGREFGRGFARGQESWGMRGHGMRGNHGMMLSRLVDNPEMREKLGITEEQAAKIRQQSTDFQKAEIRAGADVRIKRLELRELLSADKPDRAAIDRKLQEVSAAELAREKSAIDFHLTMRDALTADQKQKLHQLMEERHRTAGERGARRGPGQGMGMRMRQRERGNSTSPAPAPSSPNQN